jgi:hypothetical protein
MKFLTTVTEQYRVDSEGEANELIEEAKADRNSSLIKYNCQLKERKQKGEVVESYYRVTLTKALTDEKEPMEQFTITYSR